MPDVPLLPSGAKHSHRNLATNKGGWFCFVLFCFDFISIIQMRKQVQANLKPELTGQTQHWIQHF